ncbi:MAG: hypothetical protein Q9160_008756 [Pyrenula sp. 1 TL-2023]
MPRNYASAIAALNTLQSNHAAVEAVRKSGHAANKLAIPEMVEWCDRIGYKPADFNKLNIIHVAGTKGKGSTAAFISSILMQYLGATYTVPSHADNTTEKSEDGNNDDRREIRNIGLYTSPHLRFVRERIQLNGEPLSEATFTRYFYETWDRMEASAQAAGKDPADKPMYFRFLTLMAFHCYLSEGVDAAIIECGVGGEYDSTNFIDKPVVCGITSLGIDHVSLLGSTIEEIAWHKAGIMKPEILCLTVPQVESATEALKHRAEEKSTPLKTIRIFSQIGDETAPLGLAGSFQKTNASLAVAVSASWLKAMSVKQLAPFYGEIPDKAKRGLRQVRWGGRCETRREPDTRIAWHIDGGHTLESIEFAAAWFAEQVNMTIFPEMQKRVLIFNQQTRDADALVRALHRMLKKVLDGDHARPPITHAVFCSNTTFKETGFRPDLVSVNANREDVQALRVQRGLAETWRDVSADDDDGEGVEVAVVRTIEEAVALVRGLSKGEDEEVDGVVVLATGSLHLVGGLLEVLESGKVK